MLLVQILRRWVLATGESHAAVFPSMPSPCHNSVILRHAVTCDSLRFNLTEPAIP